jgi:hypothetical protein
MNADPSRAGAGGEENSWETLAEDLFGIDLGADPARDSLVVPEDLSLDEPESASSEAKAAKVAPDNPPPPLNPRAGKHEGTGNSAEKKRVQEEKRPAARSGRPPQPMPSDDDDFGADLDLDEPAAEETPQADAIEIEEEEIVVAEESGDDEVAGKPTAEEPFASDVEKRGASDEEDPYWDTLKTWQWSEEESEPGERTERRGPGGGRGGGGPRRSGGRERSGGRDRPPQSGSRPRRPEGRSEGRGERRRDERPPGRRPEVPPERSKRQPPPPPSRSEPEEIEDFGAGLLEEQPHAEPVRGGAEPWGGQSPAEGRRPREEFAEPDEVRETEEGSESVEHTDAERPPRRRRRRRRSRPRSERSGEPAERQERSESTDDTEAEIEEQAADEFRSETEPAEEPRVESEGGDAPGPRRRRRRRRRPSDRGPQRDQPAETPLTEAEAEEAFPAESSLQPSRADEDEDDEDDDEVVDAEGDVDGEGEDEAPRVYRNVPTWEEAISFLLHRRPGDSREGESGGPRGPRRDGGRRPDRGERPRV